MTKHELRLIMRQQRQRISCLRRDEAVQNILYQLPAVLETHKLVLSYASFGDELCTKALNQFLLRSRKLVLPKVEKDSLRLFRVDSLTQLKPSKWKIFEPDPAVCHEIFPSEISLALIPAIAFDPHLQRIGYGKGYYDRLVPKLFPHACVYGLGFKEQLSPFPFPVHSGDASLSSLLLF